MNALASLSWPQAAVAITAIVTGVAIAAFFPWLIFRS